MPVKIEWSGPCLLEGDPYMSKEVRKLRNQPCGYPGESVFQAQETARAMG